MKSSANCDHKKMKRQKVSQFMRIAGQDVFLENAPARVCPECGETHFEGRYLLNVEKKVLRQQKQVA